MIVGILMSREDNLVAMIPQVVSKLIKDDIRVILEHNAGLRSGYSDVDYEAVGAVAVKRKELLEKSNLVLTVSDISSKDIALMKKESILIGKFDARNESKTVQNLQVSDIPVFSLDLLPRTTIAQSMDVLSSLASLSGYKAVITAAEHYPGYLSMMTTSAGTIPPARVLILGAGVAGLQAIATAKRLGAVVEVFDVRSVVKEEVESLGAKFVEVQGSRENQQEGGYAIEQTEDYIEKQQALIDKKARKADIVITTASIPGKKAPILLKQQTVFMMKKGSIIVDMASASGGNCEGSKDNAVVTVRNVKIIGNSKLYDQLGRQASLLYSNNMYNFLKHLLKKGLEGISYDDETIAKTLVPKKKRVATES